MIFAGFISMKNPYFAESGVFSLEIGINKLGYIKK